MAKKCTPISLSEEQTGLHQCECKRPAKTDPTYRQWVRCDDIVTSWILHSLGREVAVSVEYVGDALELWTELEDRYDQTNEAKLYQTQKEINDLSQARLVLQTHQEGDPLGPTTLPQMPVLVGMAANSVSLSCDASGGHGDNSDSQFDASGNNNINLTKEQYGQVSLLALTLLTLKNFHAPLMKRPLEIGKAHDQFQF
ncbi:hypothetical protein KY285_032989 [Solanum tuberosum]|nr:hypothetical protein KY285_032989 [Solanum tuberosum]